MGSRTDDVTRKGHCRLFFAHGLLLPTVMLWEKCLSVRPLHLNAAIVGVELAFLSFVVSISPLPSAMRVTLSSCRAGGGFSWGDFLGSFQGRLTLLPDIQVALTL